MTLDEAIKHCEEQAELLEESAESCDLYDPVEKQIACKSGECAAEHRQLAEWLKDYKRLKEEEPFMNKPCVAHQVCHEDKVKVLGKIKDEICDIDDEIVLNPNSLFEQKKYVRVSNVFDIINKYKERRG